MCCNHHNNTDLEANSPGQMREKLAISSSGNHGTKIVSSPTCHRDEFDASSILTCSQRNIQIPITSQYRVKDSTTTQCKESLSSYAVTRRCKGKRVQFKVDSLDSNKVSCCFYNNFIELNLYEVRSNWYKSSDIKKMRRDIFSEALAVRGSTALYLEQFNELYTICECSTSDIVIPHRLALSVAGSEYRGFESLIFLEDFRPRQRETIQEVLSIQEQFLGLCTPDQLGTELHTVSTRLTEHSRRLAMVMGIGDAIAVGHMVPPRTQESTKILVNDELFHKNERKCKKYMKRIVGSPYEV